MTKNETLEETADRLMLEAARDAGMSTPDLEDLHWSQGKLMSYNMTLYPDERKRARAYEAWLEYQES